MRFFTTIFTALTLSSALLSAIPERKMEVHLKNLARLQGVRSNQLLGYGVVVGLEGTGDKDQTKFTVQSLTNLMARQGLSIDPSTVKVKNVAAVMVTAELPAFARAGQRIDVTVSSTGDAKSLAGGTLLMTPLMGNDNVYYAVAQGSVLVGGFVAAARGGANTAVRNHPTAGRIPDGALVESELHENFADRASLRYTLIEDDFSTAVRVVGAINEELGEIVAKAQDPRTIDVTIPKEFQGKAVELIARLENLSIQVQPKSRVVVNEKTGTLIMGTDVRIGPVNIIQGDLSIEVSSAVANPQSDEVSSAAVAPQPESLNGDNTPAAAQNVAAGGNKGKTLKVDSGVTVGQLAESLNTMGVIPRDLVAILQAIKDAGALTAELRIL
ncbi:MAG: flagellar basal body P-ring protein FlgI [Holophagales bacterium]|nr:flagellar basal body P-ring protein FlgI [Holophagales bacterium]